LKDNTWSIWFMEMFGPAIGDADLDEKDYFGRALFGKLHYHPVFSEFEKDIWYQQIES
jgi:hypothetical protein